MNQNFYEDKMFATAAQDKFQIFQENKNTHFWPQKGISLSRSATKGSAPGPRLGVELERPLRAHGLTMLVSAGGDF